MKRALIIGGTAVSALAFMVLGTRWGINTAWENEMRRRGLWRG